MRRAEKTKLEIEAGFRARRRVTFAKDMEERYGPTAVTVYKVGDHTRVRLDIGKDKEFVVFDEPSAEFPSEEMIAKILLVMP
jgi:hypothetical protein